MSAFTVQIRRSGETTGATAVETGAADGRSTEFRADWEVPGSFETEQTSVLRAPAPMARIPAYIRSSRAIRS